MAVKTRVKVILDIQTDSLWGDDCTIEQIKKQSIESANRIVYNAIKDPRISIEGKTKCLNIIINDEN